ncbi:MAG: trehalose-phosphatase [Acidobacteria bacterium]|nr:trehalose-phosphatase [Acidobacteriota bacterium]
MTVPRATVEDLVPLIRHALFFDVDGTLLEFQDRPEQVLSNAGLNGILEVLLVRTRGAVALVSGRGLADLDRIFSPLVLTAVGLHGAVVRGATGVVERLPIENGRLGQLKCAMSSWIRSKPGLLLEDKGASVAVHFRQVPELADEVRSRMQAWHAEFGDGFELQPGKMVLEARPAGVGKGGGIRDLMAAPPFHGRIPVFFGDDDTDEDAFLAVRDLRGCSIKVGSGPTCAIRSIPDPAAVRSLLRNVVASVASFPSLP